MVKRANKGWPGACCTVDCWCGRVDMSSSDLQPWMMVFIDALQVIKYAACVKTHKQCRFTQQSAQQNSDSLYPQREGEKERKIALTISCSAWRVIQQCTSICVWHQESSWMSDDLRRFSRSEETSQTYMATINQMLKQLLKGLYRSLTPPITQM